jgi:allantoin racemase
MRIAVINPNTTASMTRRIGAAARASARSGTEIMESQSGSGPDAIEGPFDDAMAVPGLLKAIKAAEANGADAHVIACFDDTGLAAARALSSRPVIGIGEAAFHLASLIAHSFCVVTTLARSAPVIEDNIRRYGFEHRCRRVFASDIAVLELDNPASGAVDKISGFIAQGRGLGAEAVVLGCAGMADFANELQQRHGLPVVEGVSAAVALAEALVSCKLSTSKTGTWAPPTRGHLLGQL